MQWLDCWNRLKLQWSACAPMGFMILSNATEPSRSVKAVALIPPREDAVVRGKSPFEQRDENVREIKSKGRKAWKRESTYHRRSLVETAFFRLKTIFSDRLRSRRTDTQTTEATTRCIVMNRMTSLAMPQSYTI